ncbi:MAG: hypothetical protein IPN11_15670 [Opitutaceae bacterium]|nr:hypothetical protein [Opitutaceae bacterium]
MKNTRSTVLALAASLALATNSLFGGPVLTGFDSSSLAANDDGSTGFVNFGLGDLNFFGTTYTGAYLNNNGNMTFSFAEGTYTPSAITGSTNNPMIASFFADVDTRATGSGLMQYGTGTFEGRAAFGQTWRNVGYFPVRRRQA